LEKPKTRFKRPKDKCSESWKGGKETKVNKLGKTIALAVIVAVLIFSLFGVALAADPTAEASRTIDPQVVERGEEVEVTVEFTSLLGESKAFALLEDYPDGWEFTRGTDDAIAFKPGPPPEWVWFVVGAGATKTVTYTLTVPMDAEAGNYTIEGTVTGDEVVNPVGGDTTITVRVLYDLNISSTAGGSVTIPGEGTFSYDTGTVVNLVAIADEGYQFTGWTGDIDEIGDPASAVTTITVGSEYFITANFCERPVVSLGFNGVEAGPSAEFDYCEGVDLTVTLFEEYAGQSPYTITWAVAENSTLDGMATVSKGETLFSEVLDAGVYTIQVTSVVDDNGCEAEAGFLTTCQAIVTVHEPSTYQFIYGTPEHVVACEEAEIPVTFQTDVLGFCGYDNVRYKFYADGPGDVTFKATDSEEVEHVFVNSGYWELEIGLGLPADYSETTNWTVHFSTPGEYSITFSLVDATTDEIIAGLTEPLPLTVEPGDILNYYRGLHEPADEVITLDLLAAADDWIADVAMPCFGEPITMAQLLMLADEWIAAG